MEVPRSLRTWLVVHAAVDLTAALPLLVAPEFALGRLGWAQVDAVSARLVGAALLAIGAASLFARDASLEVTRAVLRLNVVWSLAGALALFMAIGAGAPPAAWAALSAFIAFSGVWLHHAIRFRQLDRVARLDDEPAPDDADADPETGPSN
jgi:hypothetical protein